MSEFERFSRDHVERRQSEYRTDHINPDDWHDDRKDRALSDSAFDDAEDLWGVR